MGGGKGLEGFWGDGCSWVRLLMVYLELFGIQDENGKIWRECLGIGFFFEF